MCVCMGVGAGGGAAMVYTGAWHDGCRCCIVPVPYICRRILRVASVSARHTHVDSGAVPLSRVYPQVMYTTPDGETTSWMISRRYSEFDDFNKNLIEKFEKEVKNVQLNLGGKKLFGNQSADFIKKRGSKLVTWLHALTSPEFLQQNVLLEKTISKFLWHGAYEKQGKGKSGIARVPFLRKMVKDKDRDGGDAADGTFLNVHIAE